MDSKLVVEQMSGRWKVKHPDLAQLHAQARTLASQFARISYAWVPRERKHDDRLANEAMDAAAGISGKSRSPRRPQFSPSKPSLPSSAGWTRCARHGDQAAVVAARADRVVGAAPLFRARGTRDPLTRTRAAAGGGGGAESAQRGGIAAAISSPLQRAYETAAAAARALGLDVTADDELDRDRLRRMEGLTFAEAAERDPELHRRWLRDTSVEPPGGESFDDVMARVCRTRDWIIERYPGATVLVVSHVTPIKTLLRLALDAGPGILYRLHLDLASLSIAEFLF